jgi:hypothetical protein
MRALSTAEVLSVWEQTRGHKPLRQALALLACAAPERSLEQWAEQPVGQVCRALFRLRSILFGPGMPGVASCPRCGERVEFVFQCRDAAPELAAEDSGPRKLRIDGEAGSVEMRLPSAADLLASQSAEELFTRCTEGRVDPDRAWIKAASEQVAEADPLAETLLDLSCPACGNRWQALLDIAVYLSHEVAHQARKLLTEVHRLASAYGWREQEILALNPARRQAYLELARA